MYLFFVGIALFGCKTDYSGQVPEDISTNADTVTTSTVLITEPKNTSLEEIKNSLVLIDHKQIIDGFPSENTQALVDSILLNGLEYEMCTEYYLELLSWTLAIWPNNLQVNRNSSGKRFRGV